MNLHFQWAAWAATACQWTSEGRFLPFVSFFSISKFSYLVYHQAQVYHTLFNLDFFLLSLSSRQFRVACLLLTVLFYRLFFHMSATPPSTPSMAKVFVTSSSNISMHASVSPDDDSLSAGATGVDEVCESLLGSSTVFIFSFL
jgi:hypothetical protein